MERAIIKFPVVKKVKQIKNIDGIKYFNDQQIKLLRLTVRNKAQLNYEKGNVTGVKE
ncbi:MAG: hypothetical protein GY710_15840 [Desulfobacteraceae bacterium]|nr:hypothetical protein [Desulfobacteraceae bacterium]